MLLALNDCWLQWKKNYPKTFGLCGVSILLCLLNLNTMEKYVSGFHHDRARKEGSEWINRCIINSAGNWVKQHEEKSGKFSHDWRFTHCCKCNGLNVSPVFIVKYCVLFNVFLLKDKFWCIMSCNVIMKIMNLQFVSRLEKNKDKNLKLTWSLVLVSVTHCRKMTFWRKGTSTSLSYPNWNA